MSAASVILIAAAKGDSKTKTKKKKLNFPSFDKVSEGFKEVVSAADEAKF